MNDLDKTIPPRREPAGSWADNVTMPGKRDRKPDGRFAVGDLIMYRYKVLAELGQGGMGVVYRCLDETAGIEIALKALPPELSHNTLEMEDIKENFQLVAKLVHQNIAISKQLEKDDSNGNYYLIMECCEGEDLRRWIRRKRKEGVLKLEDVLPIVQQVADALDYAHEQKIIHRDIKPGNIMINANGRIKVLDFGLAAQIHTSMTRVSMAYHGTSGTGPYMAPEQWRGRAQGAPADQYALAVMTYEMIAGHLPFESTDAAVLREAVLNDTPEDVADISNATQDAIKRAMSREPAERFESCSDFVAALNGKKSKARKIVKKGGFPKWGAGLLIAVLLGAGGTGYYLFDKQQKEQNRIAEERLKKLEQTVAKAESAVATENWKVALDYANAALEIDPSNLRALKIKTAVDKITAEEKLNQLKKEIYQLQIKVSSQLKEATSETDRGQHFGKHIDKANTNYDIAKTAFDKNDYANAKQFFLDSEKECLWIIKNKQSRKNAKFKIEQFKQMIATAEKYSAKKYVSVLYSQMMTLQNESIKLFENAEFEQSIDKTEKADRLCKNIIAKAKTLYRLELLNNIDSAITKKQLDNAVRLINETKGLFPGDVTFAEKETKVLRLQQEKEAYDNIRMAKQAQKNEKWNKVIQLTDSVLKVFPNNKDVLQIRKQAEDNLIHDDESLKNYLLQLCKNLKKGTSAQESAAKRLMNFKFQDFSQKGYSSWEAYTLLCDAINVGASLTAVRYLVEQKNQPVEKIVKYTCYTPLCYATLRGNLPMMKYLLSRGASCNPNYQVDYGVPPLLYAEDLAATKLLVENGADVTWQNKAKKTLADIKPFEIAQYLISRGSKLTDPQDIYRKAASDGQLDYLKKHATEAAQVEDLMIFAIYSGDIKLIQYLETLGLSYTVASKTNKVTALHAACTKKSSKKLFQYIMQKTNLHIDVRDKQNNTPLMDAIRNNQKEIVQILLGKGADVKAQNDYGYTPLYIAIDQDNFDLVKSFVQKGAEVNARCNKNKWTLIFFACMQKNHEIIRYLCKNGADLNASNDAKAGWGTALNSAVYEKDIPMIKLLLELGADPMKVDAAGYTPMSLANDPTIKKLLLEKVLKKNNGQLIASTASELKDLIQSASKDQIIKLKPGTYEFNDSVLIRTPLKLVGEDPVRTIIRFYKDFFVWETTKGAPVEMRNLTIDFKNRSHLSMREGTSLLMKNCKVSGEYYYSIWAYKNCVLAMENCETGIWAIGENCLVGAAGGRITNTSGHTKATVSIGKNSRAFFKDITITGNYKHGVMYINGQSSTIIHNAKISNDNGPALNTHGNIYAENCTLSGYKSAVRAGHKSAFFNSCRFIASENGVIYSGKTQAYNCTYQGYGKMFDSDNAKTVYSKIIFPKHRFEQYKEAEKSP